MPPRLSWRNLIPGLVALTVLVLVAVGVVMFAGVGKVRGETVRVHVLTDQARGLMRGSEVWLDGQRAGVVHHVGFRAPSADTLHRVVIAVDIREDAAARLRHDSRIQVRPGGSVIGPIVVFLESGTPAGRAIGDGDTLHAVAQSDAELVMERVGAATAQLPALKADAEAVVRLTRSPEGTVGLLLTRGMPAEFRQLRATTASLRQRLGGGAAGNRPAGTLRRDVAAAMARVDSVRALLASPDAGLGRFRRDSSLLRAVAEIGAELDSLQRVLTESRGTFWRLQNDSALVLGMADARREMALLFEDLQRRPLRYINF